MPKSQKQLEISRVKARLALTCTEVYLERIWYTKEAPPAYLAKPVFGMSSVMSARYLFGQSFFKSVSASADDDWVMVDAPSVEITLGNKTAFVFDLDDTLMTGHSLKKSAGPLLIPDEFDKIKKQMQAAIDNGHKVWIVTANWTYKKEDLKRLFTPEEKYLYEHIAFFNSWDIRKTLKLDHFHPTLVHDQGLKADFLLEKLKTDPEFIDHHTHCTLYDDHDFNINRAEKIKQQAGDGITLEAHQVRDYTALRSAENPKPDKPLSTVFAAHVAAAGESAKPIYRPRAAISHGF